MPTPIVVDLSHHNTIPVSLKETAAAGIVGVIHKATEGGSFVDSDVDARWYLAREAGLLWGLYHFMRPGNQAEHAAHFVEVATVYGDENTLLAADHEDARVSLDDLKQWLQHVERLTGRRPVIYSGHVLKDQLGGCADPEISGYLLWLAQYAATPTWPPGFDSCWLWQYSDKGSVPGISPPTDVNAGDAADVVARWSGGSEPAPEPEPEDEAEVLVEWNTTKDGSVTMTMTPGVGVKVTMVVNGQVVE
jgi:lysozyme